MRKPKAKAVAIPVSSSTYWDKSDSPKPKKKSMPKKQITDNLEAFIEFQTPNMCDMEYNIHYQSYSEALKRVNAVIQDPFDSPYRFMWQYYGAAYAGLFGPPRRFSVKSKHNLSCIPFDANFHAFLKKHELDLILTYCDYNIQHGWTKVPSGMQFSAFVKSNKHGIVFYIEGDFPHTMIHVMSPEKADMAYVNELFFDLRELEHEVEYEDEEREIPSCMIVVLNEYNNYQLVEFNVRQRKQEMDLPLYYPNVNHDKISKFFSSDVSELFGKLLLLCGQPGTGKTSYIRYLINEIISGNNRIVFMNADIFQRVGEPKFAAFAMQHLQDTIVVIEDAEKILVSREDDTKSPISDLLNITDGILGDALNMKIIATYNTSTTKVDSALRRPGRLYHLQEFPKHTFEQAQEFLIKQGSDIVIESGDYSLAELFEKVNDSKSS